MHDMLFHAFFADLRREGIPVGVRDYARIRTLISTRREWTVPAVRDCLRSLLVHDPTERLAFDRIFGRFFDQSEGSEQVQPLFRTSPDQYRGIFRRAVGHAR